MQLLIFLVILLLFACSDSGTDSGIAQAETVYGLGECEAVNEGVVKLVTSENQYYKCVNGNWEIAESPVQSSSSNISPFAGSSSSNKAFSGLDTESSASFRFLSMDSKSEYDSVKQTLKDFRDGQTYRTVKIGDQVWMAENLNYRYLEPTADEDSSSFCYDGNPANCTKYGRLYMWSAAMDSAGIIEGNMANGCGSGLQCAPSGTVRGVCPKGWHLPIKDEWNALITAVGSFSVAGKMLKSETGWESYSGVENTDTFGFSALPAGDNYRGYYAEGNYAFFWSSTEGNNFEAYSMYLGYRNEDAYLYFNYKCYGYSIRCLKD